LQKFEDVLADSSQGDRSRFFHDNMYELLHGTSAA
jgi:hypothetical protein